MQVMSTTWRVHKAIGPHKLIGTNLLSAFMNSRAELGRDARAEAIQKAAGRAWGHLAATGLAPASLLQGAEICLAMSKDGGYFDGTLSSLFPDDPAMAAMAERADGRPDREDARLQVPAVLHCLCIMQP